MARYYFNPNKQKIISLLAAGAEIGFSRSPKHQWKIIKSIPREWREIDKRTLKRIIREFHRDRLVDFVSKKDSSAIIVLSERGKLHALRYKLDELSITIPTLWDRKWRMVLFDVPEKKKRAREALRSKLRELGFVQFQKSAWVTPYPCRDVIDFVVEVFEMRQYVQYLEVTSMTHDAKLRLHFGLPAE